MSNITTNLGLGGANLDVKKAKTLSDKKLAVKFAPIGKECDAFVSRVNRYLSNQSVLNLGSAAVRSAPYVLGTSSSKAADFFRARAAFAEVALMAAVSTVFNLLCAIGSTALALGTFGQVKGFNEMTKRNWLHTGLAAFTTASGAAGVFAPTIGAGAFKYACKKTIASFANQAQEIFQHAKEAKLGEHGLARALFAHYKETLQNMGHTAIQVGSYISADVAKILDDNAALMIEDTFATKKEELDKEHKAKQKSLKEGLKSAKKELKNNDRNAALERFSPEEINKLREKYPQEADFTNKKIAKELEKKFAADLKAEDKAYAKAVKKLGPEQEKTLARSSTFFNTLKNLARDEMTLAGFEEIVETLVGGVEQKAKGDEPKYKELVEESKGLLATLVGQSLNAVRTATAGVNLGLTQANPVKKKKQQKALVKDAQKEIKLAGKDEVLARISDRIVRLGSKKEKLTEKATELQSRLTVLKGKKDKGTKLTKNEKAEAKKIKTDLAKNKKALKALEKQLVHEAKNLAKAVGIKEKSIRFYVNSLDKILKGKTLSDESRTRFDKIEGKIKIIALEMKARAGSKPVFETTALARAVFGNRLETVKKYAPTAVTSFVSGIVGSAEQIRQELKALELTQNGKFALVSLEAGIVVSKTGETRAFTCQGLFGNALNEERFVYIGSDGRWYVLNSDGSYAFVRQEADEAGKSRAIEIFGKDKVNFAAAARAAADDDFNFDNF